MAVAETKSGIPLIIGVSILDISMAMTEDMPTALDGAMYHAKAAQSAGGVGRNLADAIYKLYGKVNFISLIGNDSIGEVLLKLMPEALLENIQKDANYRTSSCIVLFDRNGECKVILGDMDIHKNFSPDFIIPYRNLFKSAPLIIIDGNLPMDTISFILEEARKHKVPVFYEPTDLRIAGQPYKYVKPYLTHQIRIISPNLVELRSIVEANKFEMSAPAKQNPDFQNLAQVLEVTKSMILSVHHLFDCIVVTLGQHGVVLCLNSSIDPYMKGLFSEHKYVLRNFQPNYSEKKIIFFPTPMVIAETDVVNVSGAGDSFSGGFISGLLKEYTVSQALALGFVASREALLTTAAVPNKYFSSPSIMEYDIWHSQLESWKKRGNMNEMEL